MAPIPTLAVFKLASCDGCQLTLLDCEDELLTLAGQVEIAHFIDTLATSAPVSHHVDVDFELRGCPIDRRQLLEVITAFLSGRKPDVPDHSVCFECKRRGTACVTVAHGTPCLGPVTQAGCGAICPSYGRGCYSRFGPSGSTNLPALIPLLHRDGMDERDTARFLRTFNVAAFAEEGRS
uniref:Oxidoreductase n=1 Tax=Streptomyces sp. NBC_00003 TaxID=2903608 RepID=A0AAU2UXG0_9ACTN